MTETKRVWVLLRGLSREKAHWGDFPTRLSRTFPQDLIWHFDLPGCGDFYHYQSPLTISQLVDDVRVRFLARRAKVNQSDQLEYVAVAMSLGGMIVTDWMRRFSNDFRSVALINSSLAEYSKVWERISWRALMLALPIAFTGKSLRERLILYLTSNHYSVRKNALPAWLEIQRSRPVRVRTLLRQLIAAARYRGAGEVPVADVALFCSAQDRIVSPECSKAISEAWGCDTFVHDNAGHDIALDDPDWLVKGLTRWQANIRS